MKHITIILITILLYFFCLDILLSCSDDPDTSNYYTFTNEMMSDYLTSRPEFSMFVEVIERASFMDMLSAYGAYTCFAPTNEAFEVYLQKKGLSSISDLSTEDCDTIARTHLVNNMYATSDMYDGVLASANMNRRYLEIQNGVDDDNNSVVFVNRNAHTIFELQDDSVENGIMQPITGVLESSNRMLCDVMELNPNISLFVSALIATSIRDSLYKYKDASYDASLYSRYYYTSHVNKETATAPDEKRYGFTAFVPTDKVLKEKYGIENLDQLYDLACKIYDPIYGGQQEDSHDKAHYTDRENPLNRFISYHILPRDVKGWNYLTPLNDIGIRTTVMNPQDWYETLLTHTLMKIEKLTVVKYSGSDELGSRYINRRYDSSFKISGAKISQTLDDGDVISDTSDASDYEQDALNGRYFYVDDILSFSEDTRDIVQNTRIRMDVSTIFPELMTNDIRQNGNVKYQDPDYDETAKYGRNYFFPDGYLENVTCSGYFIYRRPHDYYDSYEGDEFNLFGNYDITFRLPPVPYEGDWQIRLGYAAESTRGIAQIYFDNIPQGIPLDMTKLLNDASIMGSDWVSDYSTMTTTELAADQKTLKNKGYYRGAEGGYRYDGAGATTYRIFSNLETTLRRVLCTVHITPNEDHFLRIRSVSTKQGNDNEFMLDYIEFVPKSIYGVTDEAQIEDML